MVNKVSEISKHGLRAGGLKDSDFNKENIISKKMKDLDTKLTKSKLLKVNGRLK